MSIPREEIPWYPTIEQELCSNCGICVDFCTHGVYAVEDVRTMVVAPYNWDNELDLSVRPYRNLAMYIEYHHFALAEELDAWYTTGLTAYRRDPTGRSGTS